MIRERVAFVDGRPEPEALHGLLTEWHDGYREQRRPGANVRLFEQFRSDVLTIYYASPAGRASVGYAGPVHRSHPVREVSKRKETL